MTRARTNPIVNPVPPSNSVAPERLHHVQEPRSARAVCVKAGDLIPPPPLHLPCKTDRLPGSGVSDALGPAPAPEVIVCCSFALRLPVPPRPPPAIVCSECPVRGAPVTPLARGCQSRTDAHAGRRCGARSPGARWSPAPLESVDGWPLATPDTKIPGGSRPVGSAVRRRCPRGPDPPPEGRMPQPVPAREGGPTGSLRADRR